MIHEVFSLAWAEIFTHLFLRPFFEKRNIHSTSVHNLNCFFCSITHLSLKKSTVLFRNIKHLTYVINKGAVFDLLFGNLYWFYYFVGSFSVYVQKACYLRFDKKNQFIIHFCVFLMYIIYCNYAVFFPEWHLKQHTCIYKYYILLKHNDKWSGKKYIHNK